MNHLKIKNYIVESNNDVAKQLLYSLCDKKQQVLLISAMKTGKTTFVMEYLFKHFREAQIQLIFVSPTNSLLNNVQSRYKVIKCNGNSKSIKLDGVRPVISTTDSLPKVVRACEETNQQFLLVYDEVHQVIENSSFREKLRNPFIVYKEDLCVGLLGMTATPEPLENMDFDTRFYIDVENKFCIAAKTVIVKEFVNNDDNILALLKMIKEKHKDKIIFARINDKTTLKLLRAKLNNAIAWYRVSNEIKEGKEYVGDMDKLEEILQGNDIPQGIDYILTSSLGDVGVEYLLKDKPIVIDFIDRNSSLVADIQFSGRFRNGIDTLYFVGKFDTPKEDFISKLPNQKLIYEEEVRKRKAVVEALNSIELQGSISEPGIITYKDEKGKIKVKLDEYSLKQYVYKKSIRFYLQNFNLFRKYLKEHLTFNTKKIEIVDYLEMDLKSTKELRVEKKLLQKVQKQHEEDFLNTIKSEFHQNNNDLLEIVLNYNNHLDQQWKVKEYVDLISIWENDYLEDYRERYRLLKKLLCHNESKFSNVDILEISLKKADFSNLKKQISFINYNILYSKDKEIEPVGKDMILVFTIRNYISKIKGKERDVYLSNTFKEDILEEVRKKKSLSKITPITLDKYLMLIYSIKKVNKINAISSIRTKF